MKNETVFYHGTERRFALHGEKSFRLTILIMNVIWATGGGAINVVFERMGGVFFAGTENWNPDVAVALLWTAGGLVCSPE
jgi:hypothetical protein